MSVLFSPQPKTNGLREKSRSPNGLPVFSSAVQEKMHRHAKSSSWVAPMSLDIPGVRNRRLRIWVLNPARIHQLSVSRFGRKRGPLILALACASFIFAMFALAKRFGTEEKQWPAPLFREDPSTLVFGRDDLQKIWKWEVESGHYPSSHDIPKAVGLTVPPLNPALPPKKIAKIPSRFRPPTAQVTNTIGHGPKRVYLDIQARPPNVAYPPRPVPGSAADLDIVMEHCDFSTGKYVRDCLEVLRLGGGLDNENRLRRGKFDEWKYIYLEDGPVDKYIEPVATVKAGFDGLIQQPSAAVDPNAGLTKKPRVEWDPPVQLPAPLQHRPYSTLPTTCDPESPRLFHMFWTGPFTDKPYIALMSFLFTQNVRLHMHEEDPDATVCRPQFWLWINPGPAASMPNPNALHDMYEQLKTNPWASPFLHPRFKGVISFKLWNTTEQLDGIPEIKNEWRVFKDTLFNSGGNIIPVPQKEGAQQEEAIPAPVDEAAQADASPTKAPQAKSGDDDDMLNRLGSKSASSYDRLSVILSDMARFVLCHRFGGVYLDADTIFLRDWEELWGWKGAFAYRWSRLEKYNTAVLRLNKGSALGTFLFRTALKNGLDFHPMTVSRYTKDAYLEGLLLRLPDALFDSAWLNTEYYQRDRPPQPYITEFVELFETPAQTSAAPQALGFDGFFRGAYSYHFHNFWWKPFDPARNFPDLGPRFIEGERLARTAESAATASNATETAKEDQVADDKRDLDWSTVLKRTFEAYIRGERPNMYGEWLVW